MGVIGFITLSIFGKILEKMGLYEAVLSTGKPQL